MASLSRQLSHATARGAVETRARRRLGIERLELSDLALERIEALVSAESTVAALRAALDALPPEQREAVVARVVEEDDYDQIADRAGVSETVIRKRVSRGLAGLRARMKEDTR